MIQINLLEKTTNQSRRRVKTSSGGGIGNLLLIVAVVVMVSLNGVSGWWAFNKVNVARTDAMQIKQQIDDLQAKIDAKHSDSEAIARFEEVITNQKHVLASLDPSDRILWCQKINQLAELMPSSVFLDEIVVEEIVRMIETEESKKARAAWEKKPQAERGPEPETVKKPVIHYELTLQGLASGRDNVEQFDNVLAFQRALVGHEMTTESGESVRFMNGFEEQIDFESIEATVYEGMPVNQFVFKLKTIPMGEDKPALANEAAEGTKQVAKVD